jgi:hypothetical protein
LLRRPARGIRLVEEGQKPCLGLVTLGGGSIGVLLVFLLLGTVIGLVQGLDIIVRHFPAEAVALIP